MDRSSLYYRQVQLLIRLFPIIRRESCFALKGGTAINLFIRDLPRLSVDIDLVYLPLDDRETALPHVRDALSRISKAIAHEVQQAVVIPAYEDSEVLRVFVSQGTARVKIELSPVLRGTVFAPIYTDIRPAVEREFGFAEMPILAVPDLYAGKICAALDRQHPRDLFDIKLLLDNEGINSDLRKTFLVYLISHHRPIAELISPTLKNIRDVFENEFVNMTTIPISVEQLEETRDVLIKQIHTDLTQDETDFLLSFKAQRPNWNLLGLEGVENLPPVKWKILNLSRMSVNKHRIASKNLQDALSGR